MVRNGEMFPLEKLLQPKKVPTRREKLNLLDDIPTPPSTPPSDSSPPPPTKLRPAMRKSRRKLVKKTKKTNQID